MFERVIDLFADIVLDLPRISHALVVGLECVVYSPNECPCDCYGLEPFEDVGDHLPCFMGRGYSKVPGSESLKPPIILIAHRSHLDKYCITV